MPSSSLPAAWIARAIERRLRGYRHTVVAPDERLPPRRPAGPGGAVAVIGGGIAGITAAATLAGRGFDVTLLERNAYLGGKVGAWTETLAGEPTPVEHGFHAFFRHYYNLRDLLARAGADRAYAPIGDYVIVKQDGTRFALDGDTGAPLLNLLALASRGLYRFRDLVLNPRMHRLDPFLRYERDDVFARYDDTSFEQFEREAGLPPSLRLMFNTFARAFFADPDRMSLAELIKSFHFYYLSHDHGLAYDYVAGDYASALIRPLASHLEREGARVRLSARVDAIERDGARFVVGGERYDAVVLAADVVGTRAILGASRGLLAEHPSFAAQIERLRAGQRYAVLRLWLDRPIADAKLPVFVITDRVRALDAVAFVDRVDPALGRWAQARGGSVCELHSYALPDDALATDADVRAALVDELGRFFPAARGARVEREHLQVRADFPAFHTGMYKDRPTHTTPVPGLYLAGDWVKLPHPAMLMEAACMAGLLCANEVLARAGVRAARVDAVPPEGVLAGLPRPPGGGR